MSGEDEKPDYRDWQKELEEAGLLMPGTSIWTDGSGTWFGSRSATCEPGSGVLANAVDNDDGNNYLLRRFDELRTENAVLKAKLELAAPTFILITEVTAHVILGALAASYGEGLTGIESEENQKLEVAERRLIEAIRESYPDVVKLYDTSLI